MRQPLKSSIFEDYVAQMEKMAQESKELKKYKSDDDARVGSDSIKDIEQLYNTHPEPSKGMEYDLNIIQLAHPKAVIIAPSYDTLNGLVENENERADIIRNLINKSLPSGSIVLTRNATNELTMELVRIANDLDNADEQELRELADITLESLKKKAFDVGDLGDSLSGKVSDVGTMGEGAATGAAIGATLGGVLGVFGGPLAPATVSGGIYGGAIVGAAAGGLLAGLFKTTPQVKNIQENAKEVLTQLQDLKSKVPEQAEFFTKIEQIINELAENTNKYQALLDGMQSKALTDDHSSGESKEMIEAAANLKKSMDLTKKVGVEFSRRAALGEFAKAAPGKLTSILYHFISDDIEDVSDAFKSLIAAIDKLDRTMNNLHSEAKEKITEAPVVGPKNIPQKETDTAIQSAPKEEKSELNRFMDFLKGIGG